MHIDLQGKKSQKRLARQNNLTIVRYHDLMTDNIDEVIDKRVQA